MLQRLGEGKVIDSHDVVYCYASANSVTRIAGEDLANFLEEYIFGWLVCMFWLFLFTLIPQEKVSWLEFTVYPGCLPGLRWPGLNRALFYPFRRWFVCGLYAMVNSKLIYYYHLIKDAEELDNYITSLKQALKWQPGLPKEQLRGPRHSISFTNIIHLSPKYPTCAEEEIPHKICWVASAVII